MAATRILASNVGGVAVGPSANGYCPPCTGALVLPTVEANGTITFRSAGTISNLTARVISGNRTSGSPHVCLYLNGAQGNGYIDLAPGGSPVAAGEYTDAVHTDAVAAGDTVSIHAFGGGSGNSNWTFSQLGFVFTADTGNVTIFGATGALAYSTASETSYRQPACGAAKTTTAAEGEWLVKLPAGVSGVTIRNLYVRWSANTRTADTVISVSGASGAGTAPSATIPGSSASGVVEDTSHSIVAADGDKVSIKVVTGAGTSQTLTVEEITLEVYSNAGVSFLIAGNPAGAAYGSTNMASPLGGLLGGNTTEARSQATFHLPNLRLGLLSGYWIDGTTGTHTLRAGGANVGSPGNVAVASSTGAWVTDSTNTYDPASSALLNTNFTRTATISATCLAITIWSPTEQHSGSAVLTGHGTATPAISTARSAAPALTGHGTAVPAQATNRNAAPALTGHGTATYSYQVGGAEEHSGTATLTGHGTVVATISTARAAAPAGTGAGTAAAAASKGAQAAPALAGAGTVAPAITTARQAAPAATGHGTAVATITTARQAAPVATGHGTVTYTYTTAVGEAHSGTASATGHGTVAAVITTGRRVAPAFTGHGTVAPAITTARAAAPSATGHGSLAATITTARAAQPALAAAGAATATIRTARQATAAGTGAGTVTYSATSLPPVRIGGPAGGTVAGVARPLAVVPAATGAQAVGSVAQLRVEVP